MHLPIKCSSRPLDLDRPFDRARPALDLDLALIVRPRGPVIVVSRSTVWPIANEPETISPSPKAIKPKSFFILIIALPSL